MINKDNLEKLQQINILDCDKDSLIDINSIPINKDLPKIDRIKKFIEYIKNPYIFKIDDTVVKVNFVNKQTTLQEKINNIIQQESQKQDF